MNENKSFLITLLLVVGAGVVIGLFAFGLTGKSSAPIPTAATNAAAPVTASTSTSTPTSTSPSPADAPEPPPPVQDQPINEDTGKPLPPPR